MGNIENRINKLEKREEPPPEGFTTIVFLLPNGTRVSPKELREVNAMQDSEAIPVEGGEHT